MCQNCEVLVLRGSKITLFWVNQFLVHLEEPGQGVSPGFPPIGQATSSPVVFLEDPPFEPAHPQIIPGYVQAC